MSESKCTPGLWKIDGGSNKKGDLFIWKAGEYYGGHAIATVHGEIQEGSGANVRLIAAVPKLLEALEELVSIVDGMADGNGEVPDTFTTQPAKAAIADAKGGGGITKE